MVSPLLLCTSYRPSASDFCTELIFRPGTASDSLLAIASSVSAANTAGAASKDIIRPVTAATTLRFMDQTLPFPVNRFRHFACTGPSYATTGTIHGPCDRAPRRKFTRAISHHREDDGPGVNPATAAGLHGCRSGWLISPSVPAASAPPADPRHG